MSHWGFNEAYRQVAVYLFTGLLAFNFVQIDECNGGYIFVFGVARRGILIGAPLQ